MKISILKFLEEYSDEPRVIDRLVVSAYLKQNNISVINNEILTSCIIHEKDGLEHRRLLDFIQILKTEILHFTAERLIELFEFVVSPSDKIVNGAVYTPLTIREYIVQTALQQFEGDINLARIADLSCGCGGFLYTIAKMIHSKTRKSYSEIFREHIFGVDIQLYSIIRTKLLLSILAIEAGEDIPLIKFNLFVGDALSSEWKKQIDNFIEFDIIIGNPPYVRTRNLKEDAKKILSQWSVCRIGNPDLYIPFFQLALENLSSSGILGYITMNTFFKSLNGRGLREYFQKMKFKIKIIDFGSTQIFKSKNTYTCICFIEKKPASHVFYIPSTPNSLPVNDDEFQKNHYDSLKTETGWNLQDNEIIEKIEATGTPLGRLYKMRHGIATLKNDIFVFRPVSENKYFFIFKMNLRISIRLKKVFARIS